MAFKELNNILNTVAQENGREESFANIAGNVEKGNHNKIPAEYRRYVRGNAGQNLDNW